MKRESFHGTGLFKSLKWTSVPLTVYSHPGVKTLRWYSTKIQILKYTVIKKTQNKETYREKGELYYEDMFNYRKLTFLLWPLLPDSLSKL